MEDGSNRVDDRVDTRLANCGADVHGVAGGSLALLVLLLLGLVLHLRINHN